MDNPQAFPSTATHGITLRDWLAGQALDGYIIKAYPHIKQPQRETLAKYCYEQADAMLAERNRKE